MALTGEQVHAPASDPIPDRRTRQPLPFPADRTVPVAARRPAPVRERCRGPRRSGMFRRDRARQRDPPCARSSGAGLPIPSQERRRRARPSPARSGRAPSAGQGGSLAVPGPSSPARRLTPRIGFIGWSSETRTHTRQAGRMSPLPHSALDPGSEPFDPYPGLGVSGTGGGPEAPALPAEPPGGRRCSDSRHEQARPHRDIRFTVPCNHRQCVRRTGPDQTELSRQLNRYATGQR